MQAKIRNMHTQQLLNILTDIAQDLVKYISLNYSL